MREETNVVDVGLMDGASCDHTCEDRSAGESEDVSDLGERRGLPRR